MDIFLQQVINGLVLGSVYALVALGYTMVYGIIQLINFAHGEVLMFGALIAWTVAGLLQPAFPGMAGWVVVIISAIVAGTLAAVLNFTIEKVPYRPVRDSPHTARSGSCESRLHSPSRTTW